MSYHGRHRFLARFPLLLCVLCCGLFCHTLKASGISAHDRDLFRNTAPVLIIPHQYTSYMLSPEYQKQNDEKITQALESERKQKEDAQKLIDDEYKRNQKLYLSSRQPQSNEPEIKPNPPLTPNVYRKVSPNFGRVRPLSAPLKGNGGN